MENFYEEVYQYLIGEGIDDDEATEVVNHLYEENVHEYGLLTENKGKAVLNMLKAVGMMTGILKNPAAKQAVKTTTKKITGTPLQGNLLTKTGKAQNFTGGRTPFTGTSPVPAASSPLPQPKKLPAQSPGQMRIPGMSDRAQELRNVTGNPSLGLPGNKQGLALSGGSNKLRNKSIFQNQPAKTAPNLPKPSASTKSGNLKTGAVAGITAAGAGVALSGDKGSKTTSPVTDNQKQQKLAQQRAETRAASKPKPELTGERSASANAARQEKAKVGAQRLSSAARDFDKTFAAARKAGKSEFTWRGKRYNTKLK
jgi:hypothetical protein